jgi:hypothetical protein
MLSRFLRIKSMADETPTPPPSPSALPEESKKDTVRINLPPGLGKSAPAPPGGAPPPSKLRPPAPPGTSEDEAKKETAVLGTPLATPKPKKDTSRVQVSAAKPAAQETPRPAVKLKRDETPAAPLPPSAAAPPGARQTTVVAAPSGVDAALSVFAVVLSIAVLAYLAFIAMA